MRNIFIGDEAICQNCVAWDGDKETFETNIGLCRRKAPIAPHGFPTTRAGEYCFEWQPDEKLKEELRKEVALDQAKQRLEGDEHTELEDGEIQ